LYDADWCGDPDDPDDCEDPGYDCDDMFGFAEVDSCSEGSGPGDDETATSTPDCQDSFSQSQLGFVEANYSQAAVISATTSAAYIMAIPTDRILGWSALESGFGKTAYTPSGQFTGQYFGWMGKTYGNTTCPSSNTANFACFTSFSAAANKSLFSTKNYFQYDGLTGVAMGMVLETDLVLGYSASTAFQDVANTGYVQPNQRAGYGAAVNTDIGQVDQIVDCLKQDGIIH